MEMYLSILTLELLGYFFVLQCLRNGGKISYSSSDDSEMVRLLLRLLWLVAYEFGCNMHLYKFLGYLMTGSIML